VTRLRKIITMRDALESPAYFGGLLEGASWAPWRILLIAIAGEALTADERAIFKALTGRDSEPLEPVEEFWASRRQNARYGGPSRIYRLLLRSSRCPRTRRARCHRPHGRLNPTGCIGFCLCSGNF
jgi:hypothetical protein